MKNNLIGISGKIGSGKDTLGIIIQYLSSRNNLTGSQKEYLKDLNYLSHILNKKSNYNVKKFADKLKDIVCLLIGCTREQLEDREFKEKELGPEWVRDIFYKEDDGAPTQEALTPRKIMQLLGTEAGRQIIHPNIWVNALFADYNPKFKGVEYYNLNDYYPNWIITDVRFPNEAQAIKDRGGIVIRVNRPILKDLKDDTITSMAYALIAQAKQRKKGIYHPSETALDDYEFDHVIDNNGSIEELVEKVKQLKLV